MIFADSLPFAKAFFAAASLPESTVGLLTRFVVACLNTLRWASQAADAVRTHPRHCMRPYYTEDYCKQQAAKARPGESAPTFATQADIAADMIRAVRVPQGSQVLVLGDTAFEAKQVRAACGERGFDWITPANPERVLAGGKPRKRLSEKGKDLDAETMTRIELCPGLTDWWRHQRGSKAKAWRGKHARRYWARAETLDVHNRRGSSGGLLDE